MSLINRSLSKDLNQSPVERNNKDSSLNIKEVGYLLQMIEMTKHSGQALELALVCKMKLQSMLDKLT